MEKDTEGYSQLPKSYLKREWFFFTCISLIFIMGGYAILSLAWDQVNALRWMILTIGGTAALTLSLWRDLEHNHRTEEINLLPTLGLANWVTLLRGLLLTGLAGFLFSPVPTGWLGWIPALLYTIAATSDYIDGYLARISNQTTALGERMDMRLDGAGVLIAAALAVQYQQVPGFYMLVGLSRYLFTGGIWLLNLRNKPVYPLPSSFSRRAMAGLQMGFLAVILLPLFSPPGTYLAATLIGIPFLVNFLVDWLYVSGALKPGIAVPSRWRSLTARYLPIILRVLTALLLLVPILNNSLKPLLEPISGVTMYLQVLIAILLLLGIAGRTAAIGGLILLGFNQMTSGLSIPQYILVILYSAILYLGTGLHSLWVPEKWIINTHIGSPDRKIQV